MSATQLSQLLLVVMYAALAGISLSSLGYAKRTGRRTVAGLIAAASIGWVVFYGLILFSDLKVEGLAALSRVFHGLNVAAFGFQLWLLRFHERGSI